MGTLLNRAFNQTVVLASSTNTKDLAEELKYAVINTAVGLTVVFAILTIIIFIISLFKVIPYLQNKMAFGSASSEAVDKVVAQITEQEEAEEELINDCELVAVITAAIYASMGNEVPADGFIVRSIRRAGKQSWVKA